MSQHHPLSRRYRAEIKLGQFSRAELNRSYPPIHLPFSLLISDVFFLFFLTIELIESHYLLSVMKHLLQLLKNYWIYIIIILSIFRDGTNWRVVSVLSSPHWMGGLGGGDTYHLNRIIINITTSVIILHLSIHLNFADLKKLIINISRWDHNSQSLNIKVKTGLKTRQVSLLARRYHINCQVNLQISTNWHGNRAECLSDANIVVI